MTNFPAVLQPSSTCQWFRLLTVCCQRFTNQPIVFCVVRPTLNSLALAKRAVSLFSSRAAALVSRVSRLRRSRARALLSLNLKKKRECSQSSIHDEPVPNYPKEQQILQFLSKYLSFSGKRHLLLITEQDQITS